MFNTGAIKVAFTDKRGSMYVQCDFGLGYFYQGPGEKNNVRDHFRAPFQP